MIFGSVINQELDELSFDADLYNSFKGYFKDQTALINARDEFARLNIRASTLRPYRGFRYDYIPDDPFRLPLYQRQDFLPAIFSFGNIIFLNAQARDIQETIEPNVHQYIPIQILNKSGGPEFEPYWVLNICTRIVATNIEESNISVKEVVDLTDFEGGYKRRYTMFFGKQIPNLTPLKDKHMKLKFNKNIVQNRAFWNEWKLGYHFISDAYVEALRAVGINSGYVHNEFHAEEI